MRKRNINPLNAGWLPNQAPDYFLTDIMNTVDLYGPNVLLQLEAANMKLLVTVPSFLYLYPKAKRHNPKVWVVHQPQKRVAVTHFFKER